MDKFEQFWQLYPRRLGDNPKRPARLKFEALVKKGVDPDRIVGAAETYRQRMQAQFKVDTPYVPQAITWLNQHRFEDYSPSAIRSAIDEAEQQRLIEKYQERRRREGWK